MTILPPGTILQLMYLRERMARIRPGRFVEIGPGSGEITEHLLKNGWSGTVYDLSEETVALLEERFAKPIAEGQLRTFTGDFVSDSHPQDEVDLVISSMVMEHLDEDTEQRFMNRAYAVLRPGGMMIGLVPASMRHWGIEDDIAGHYRRYSRPKLMELCAQTQWQVQHIAGLTFPVSNVLLPISNRQVSQYEGRKVSMTYLDRTKDSGHRSVPFKTSFPPILSLVLNRFTMLPFHWLQKLFRQTESALILYFEATPDKA